MARPSPAIMLVAFSILLVLIVVFSFSLYQSLDYSHREIAQIQGSTLTRQRLLASLQKDIYSLAVQTRNAIIVGKPDPKTIALIDQTAADLDRAGEELQAQFGQSGKPDMSKLRAALANYNAICAKFVRRIHMLDPAAANEYLTLELVPRRSDVLELIGGLGEVNADQMAQKQREVLDLQDRTRRNLRIGSVALVALAFVVGFIAFRRVSALEDIASNQRMLLERHGEELRLLSQRLVQTQEEERRVLSRELHDQVGQILTALRMELGNLGNLRTDPDGFRQHLDEAKKLTNETLKTVRHLSTGLRPSILDDLGLGPALRWQLREFSQRTGIGAEGDFRPGVEAISEKERICLFRVVQEALTNCARHAHAKSVRIELSHDDSGTLLEVRDDGVGFDVTSSSREGIGLLGIEERVRELKGSLKILSEMGHGTTLQVRIPNGRA